ncbi:MAG: universal stress protein, partial [Thermoanaerobaculaceae bacterium]|nr:universal stress protein [Thermoanaerobaculaceae bacterium]
MKTIVVAVDFSNATKGVLEMAARQAKAFGAQLRLLHVVEPEPSYTAYGFTPDEFPALHAYQEEAKRRASGKLEELLKEVKFSLADATCQIAEGSPL